MSHLQSGNNEYIPHPAEIEAVMSIVEEVTKAKYSPPPMSKTEKRLDNIRAWFASHAIAAALIMFLTAGLALYTKSAPLQNTTLGLLIALEVLCIAMMLPEIISGALFARELARSPYKFALSQVERSLHRNLKYVERLASCNRVTVQYTLAHYKNERNGYEKRAGMIGGTIDKIGIFPALAGLVLLIWNLLKVPGSPGWATFFGPLIFAFYMLSIGAGTMTQKMDEVIALLEFSINSRK